MAEVERRRHEHDDGDGRETREPARAALAREADPDRARDHSGREEPVRGLHQPRAPLGLELGHGAVHRDVDGAGRDAEHQEGRRERRDRFGERRQHRRHREPGQHRREDARAAAVEQAAGGEHRGQRTDGHEEQRETELTLGRADRVLDRRHERRPAAPDGAEREERRQRPATPHTRSQPSGSCGIGHEGSGRQSSQPVGKGHSSRTRFASARTAPASRRPSAAACSSSSSSFQP